MCEKLVDGTLDVTVFEDATREMFNIHAYKIFTIDKLLNNVTKKLAQTLTDEPSKALVGLYLRKQAEEEGLDYRAKVNTLLEKENLFVMEQKTPRDVEIELMDDPETGDNQTPIEKWGDYVSRYDSTESTGEPGVGKAPVMSMRSKVAAGFDENVGKAMDGVFLHNELECKICVSTYKLKFLADSHDVFYRKKTAPAAKSSAEGKSIDNIFKDWMEENVTAEDAQRHTDWMTGKVAGGGAEAAEAGDAADSAAEKADADGSEAAAAAAGEGSAEAADDADATADAEGKSDAAASKQPAAEPAGDAEGGDAMDAGADAGEAAVDGEAAAGAGKGAQPFYSLGGGAPRQT